MSELTKITIQNLSDEEKQYLLTAPYVSALRSAFEMYVGGRMGQHEYAYLVSWLADRNQAKKEKE